MTAYLVIALGGALGSVARFACTEWIQSRWPSHSGFPWGTLLINVLGSLAIGLLAGMVESGREVLTLSSRQFLMIGVLGGYTTFSSFSLQTLMLMRGGSAALGLANVAASVGLCLLAAWLGMWLTAR